MRRLNEKITTILTSIGHTLHVPLFVFDEINEEIIFNSDDKNFPNSIINPIKDFYFSLENKPEYLIKRLTFEELYFIIRFTNNKSNFVLIGGPCLSYLPLTEDGFNNFAFAKSISFNHFLTIRNKLNKFDINNVLDVLILIYAFLEGKTLQKPDILKECKDYLMDEKSLEYESKMKISKRSIEEESKYSFNDEQKILNFVSTGDIETISNSPSFLFKKADKIIDQSDRNSKYLSVAMITLISRAAINGGMDIYASLSKSDHYIRRIDAAMNPDEISVILKQMVYDFTYEVYRLKNKKKYSTNINKAINYINLNIHSHINLENIADYVGLNPKYLSRHFIEEVGIKISTFIKQIRLEEAKSLLKYSNEDYSSIAYRLCFPSQSYFVEVFKKEFGVTPKVYREKNSKMF